MNKQMSPPAPSVTLDVDVLRSALAIAATGSVTAAAAQVGRTPAALSMQLKKLEEVLGRSLFTRGRAGKQGMEPTLEGERLLAYARRMVDLHREALDSFRGPELAGEVSIGVIDEFGGVRLAEVLAGFSTCWPKVTVTVTMGSSKDLAPKIDSGELDLSVMTPGCAVSWRDGDLVLLEEPLVWAGRAGGRAIRQRPLPLAVSSPGCAWRRATLKSLEEAGVDYRVAYVSEFYEAQKAAVHADLAVAPLPRSKVEAGLVELRAADGMPPLGTCRIALRIGANPSPAAEALAARIAESFGVSR